MGTIITLMRQQRNSIFGAIQIANMDPKEFQIEQVKVQNSEFPQVRLVPTGSTFLFGWDWETDVEQSEWSPGENTETENAPAPDWDARRNHLYAWLRNIKAEFFEPDRWEQAAAVFGEREPGDDALFTPEERAEISGQLRTILEYIAEQRDLSIEERQGLETRLVDSLDDAAAKLTRGQWKAMFLGVLITEGVHIGLESQALRDLLQFAIRAVGHLFGGLPQLPV